MSFTEFITKCRDSKVYFRGLVVRAIEDACILLMLCVGIWAVCACVGWVFRLLGVAA